MCNPVAGGLGSSQCQQTLEWKLFVLVTHESLLMLEHFSLIDADDACPAHAQGGYESWSGKVIAQQT